MSSDWDCNSPRFRRDQFLHSSAALVAGIGGATNIRQVTMQFLIVLLALLGAAARTSAQTMVADLGQCRLESGAVVTNCRVAYRTFGIANQSRSNVVLIPTWFASRAEDWIPLLGRSGIVDTTTYFAVVIESLGAGTSSSPSNSDGQPRMSFPAVTVGDMVETSHRLATEHLKLPQVYAIVGISLGGLQVFEWGVRYPAYAGRLIPITGNPRQAIYGRAFWELIARTCEDALAGALPMDSAAATLARLGIVGTTSPAGANRRATSTYEQYVASQIRSLKTVDLYEWAWHARAILTHDVARSFNGDMTQAARRWRARTLVVTALHDHSIDPQPAQEFARLIRADTLVIGSPSGHSAIFGDSAAKAAIRSFLSR